MHVDGEGDTVVHSGYRIGEVAEQTGFPPSTLRYYEDEGLLPAPDRTAAGHRVYGERHLRRLQFMARAKRLGLTLEEIADLADAWDTRECRITHGQLVDCGPDCGCSPAFDDDTITPAERRFGDLPVTPHGP